MSPHEISSVTNVTLSPDGNTIALTLETHDGASLPLVFEHKAFTKFIENLIDLGVAASKQRTGGEPVLFSPENSPTTFSSNQLTGLAVAESTDRIHMFLLLRLFDMDLTFLTTKTTLQDLAGSFVQMAKALDADESNLH